MLHVLILLGSYLLGSIPFGYLIARARGVDIMSTGSGNIGATNVLRTLGPAAGYSVFLLDVLKGVIPALVAMAVLKDEEWSVIAGLTAVVGHSLSPFLKFKGGKGIATGLGAILGSCPPVALSCFGLFLVILAISRYVSLASLFAAAMLPFAAWYFGYSGAIIGMFAGMAVLIFYRHRGNIERLRSGTERKFDPKGKKKEPEPEPEEESDES